MHAFAFFAGLGLAAAANATSPTNPVNPINPLGIDWVPLANGLHMARTETTVAQVRRYAHAHPQWRSQAERAGGGQVYEAGWVQRAGWNWRAPFGPEHAAADDEPAVHLGFDEARSICRFAGGHLPTDAQWLGAAYTEQRAQPSAPFVRGRSYPYPTGESPAGAQCLGECGPQEAERAVRHGVPLSRGLGHARVGRTPAGVNGLHDMGGNVWEWVEEPQQGGPNAERRTRGGSWWYGAAPMRPEHVQSKPPGTTVVYIGFRCAKVVAP